MRGFTGPSVSPSHPAEGSSDPGSQNGWLVRFKVSSILRGLHFHVDGSSGAGAKDFGTDSEDAFHLFGSKGSTCNWLIPEALPFWMFRVTLAEVPRVSTGGSRSAGAGRLKLQLRLLTTAVPSPVNDGGGRFFLRTETAVSDGGSHLSHCSQSLLHLPGDRPVIRISFLGLFQLPLQPDQVPVHSRIIQSGPEVGTVTGRPSNRLVSFVFPPVIDFTSSGETQYSSTGRSRPIP